MAQAINRKQEKFYPFQQNSSKFKVLGRPAEGGDTAVGGGGIRECLESIGSCGGDDSQRLLW